MTAMNPSAPPWPSGERPVLGRVIDVESTFLPEHQTGVWVRITDCLRDRELLCIDGRYRGPRLRPGFCILGWIEPPQVSASATALLVAAEPIDPAQAGPRLIPWRLAPQPRYLAQLALLVDLVTTPCLRRMLLRLFSDPAIAVPFIQVPASGRHHHSHRGGLLAHSLETVILVLGMTHGPDRQRDLLIAGALLHDIGKVRVFDCNGTRTLLGHLIDHEDLTLEVLGPWLQDLEQEWPDGANALRHIWRTRRGSDRYPDSSLREIVRQADRLSALKDRETVAFQDLPGWRNHSPAGVGERWWRPSGA